MNAPANFSTPDCKLAVRASELAYKLPREIEHGMADLGFRAVRHFNNSATDTQGFVASSPETVVVAFRGTSDLRDFITDADLFLIPFIFGAGRVHRGFNRSFESVRDEVNKHVADLERGQRILVTGHSLGGALAVLCHNHLASDVCYTFGQPRVGDKAFADWQGMRSESHFRCINGLDIVPRMPWELATYRHSGHEVFFPAFGPVQWNDEWWQHLPSDAAGFLKAWAGKGAINACLEPGNEHHVTEYAFGVVTRL